MKAGDSVNFTFDIHPVRSKRVGDWLVQAKLAATAKTTMMANATGRYLKRYLWKSSRLSSIQSHLEPTKGSFQMESIAKKRSGNF